MEMLIIGFVLGAFACWLWFQRFPGAPRFRHFLHKELSEQRPAVNAAALEKKVAELDRRLQLLQHGAADSRPVLGAASYPFPGPGECRQPDRFSSRTNRGQKDAVLAMRKDGLQVEEIAARTGMGKGAVDLILRIEQRGAVSRKSE